MHAPSRPALESLLSAVARSAAPAALCVVDVEAPVVTVERLWAELPERGPTLLWAPPEGPRFVGFGEARSIAACGAKRYWEIERAGRELFATIAHAGDAPPPRLFGGFAFHPGSARGAPWTDFGDARFSLPRVRYATDGARAWLSVAANRDEIERGTLDAAVADVRAALTRAAAPRDVERASALAREAPPDAEFVARVAAIIDAIAAERFRKIVAARRALLELAAPIDVGLVVERLGRDAPACTRFAFRVAGAAFVGATPERLVSRRGLEVRTEALAGSRRAGGDEDERALLTSEKDLAEHALVVEQIAGALAPVSSNLAFPRPPDIRRLRHVLHLTTPFTATLAAPLNVLDLVRRLHPTPAVGGVPGREAVSFIAEHEPDARGWYAAPIGWFDAAGNGDFMVALRSGVLDGARAHLYAGAGIVQGSVPERELGETELKLKTLRDALGVA
jgi:menaquinone-specific isochorismate synthase